MKLIECVFLQECVCVCVSVCECVCGLLYVDVVSRVSASSRAASVWE